MIPIIIDVISFTITKIINTIIIIIIIITCHTAVAD